MSAPCRCCGVATDRRLAWLPDTTPTGRASGREYEVGVCDDCAGLRPEEPGSAVRAALRLLGKAEGEWRLAAEAFEDAGVDVSVLLYDSRVRPEPQRKPWGHVAREDRAALRAGYARLLDLRVHAAADHDRPVPPTAPPGDTPHRGCLACGLDRQAEPWRGPVTTGAFTKPRMASGYLCSACAAALEEVGALGASMLERALMEARGLEWSEAVRLPGLRAWVSTGEPPSPTPWAHVGEVRAPEPEPTLADLRAEVAALRRELDALREAP
ncbi:MAG: hypothetical protein ACTHNS_16260 [Marmoricola sp.]